MTTKLIDLSKKVKISLEKNEIFGEKAAIVIVLDISISMEGMYDNGLVQEVVEKVLAIGMNMDDDKEIQVYAFGKNSYELEEANEHNIEGYVKNILLRNVSLENQTNYAGVMDKIVHRRNNEKKPKKRIGIFKKIFGSKEEAVNQVKQQNGNVPTLVFFITDGDNHDKPATTMMIRETSNQPIFWQFIGIGNPSRFGYLKKLDDLSDRFIDNANFFPLNDIYSISTQQLYDRILKEFPKWLKEARKEKIL